MTASLDDRAASCGLSLSPLAANVGCRIDGIDLAAATDEQFSVLMAAFGKYGGLLMREQELAVEDLVGFSGRLGTLDHAPLTQVGRTAIEGFPEIYLITNLMDREGKPMGALGNGEAVWHTDMSYLPSPPDASMLYAREVPPTGGNTFLCSMMAAYDALPEDLKALAGRLRIKHDATYNSGGYVRQGMVEHSDPRKTTGTFHPAVIRHPETGRPALYLGRRRQSYVEGYDLDESEALLDKLWGYATLPENTYEHVWQVNDVLLWDNRITMHRRDSFDPAHTRLMWRTQIQGSGAPKAYAQA
ncbi:TauD/TfdA dioxygenase family protein [Hwanghaeella sp.]|uniref:TauD/TfdA dioxygenase family protein n=1 Tax=Hwanghaeella sp. TaxID=2605943 RepID=UPI003CCBFE83